jgi:2-dehydro-3-deoxyphosphogluconate aldolase / (4S)-4-hydroxy-2-oxoglutarate aldolase
VTFRTAAAAEAIARIAALGDVLVGAGTVRSPGQLAQALAAGAQFAVAPALDERVVAAAAEAGVPFVPGVATPSEIERALDLGCDVLKLFPAATVGGPAFIKSVAPIYPDVRFIPTGGVNPDNLASYLALPSVLACGGTWICADAGEIEDRARAAVAA